MKTFFKERVYLLSVKQSMGFFLNSLEDKWTAVEANRPLMSGFTELWGSSRE